KAPIGRQDQYAAAFGGLNFIRFHENGSVDVEPVRCTAETREALSRRLMLFYIGQEREASSILTEQSRNMAVKEKFHRVEEMVELAAELRVVLEKNELNTFGEILHRGWQLKRGVASGITNSVVEANYQIARDAGAEGGKLLGAGAGGFLLLSCRAEKQQQVRAALVALREMPFALTTEGSRVLHNDGQNGQLVGQGGVPPRELQRNVIRAAL